jgi:two-component system LytT family sensor kinase
VAAHLLSTRERARSIAKAISRRAVGRRILVFLGWASIVLVFAIQWYAYDASRAGARPFRYYLWWSWYMWAVLTPLVLWFTQRFPITLANWKSAIPRHIAASLALTVVQISLEAIIGWLRHEHDMSFERAVRHYFGQHTQMSVLTYWMIVGGSQCYRAYDQMRRREVQSAELKAQLGAAQLQLLRMQLQPHFLFNTLQAATMLIHEDPPGAEDILLRLSELLRVSLDDLHMQEVSLGREIEFLEHYIGIQQRRFGDRLRFDLRIDKDVLACAVPSLVLQPLVENAIRHGIGKHKGSDVVTVRSFQNRDRLSLEVHNLIGVLDDVPESILGRGVGLSNTRSRLEQLYGQQQSLQIRNVEPRGVCAVLSIPIRRLSSEPGVVPGDLSK